MLGAGGSPRSGRGLPQLLSDFGLDLPPRGETEQAAPDRNLFPRLVSARGSMRAGRGWASSAAPLSMWRMTSEQTPVFWPLIAAPGLAPTGAQMGIDQLSGGSFYADPAGWVLRDDISTTNPNVFIFGKPGRGKSATGKCFALRMMDFGYRTLVLGDPKDEYEPLCRALGVEPFAIGHGLGARVNPLAFGPLGAGWADLDGPEAQRRAAIVFSRWLVLIRGLVGSQKVSEAPVPFTPSDELAVAGALRTLTGYANGNTALAEVTIPALWHALDEPSADLVEACRYTGAQHFLDSTRLMRDALGQLVHGYLQGLFDDHTTIAVDWGAPIQSLSLSRLEPLGDEAMGVALTCLNSWGRAQREMAAAGDLRIVVRDETWKQMRLGLEAVKSLDADLRFSRRDGDIQIVIFHKPSDPMTAGAAGSQAVAIARDLLHLGDIKVLHGQDEAVAEELGDLLGLRPMAQDLITGWAMGGPGRALWMVGDQGYKVQVVRTPLEEALTWTNAALGNYLVDGNGKTLYWYTPDTVGMSACTGGCIKNWPAFAPSGFVVPSALNPADFATIKRSDGAAQATYKGYPLYYWVKDTTRGDVTGQNVGKVWYVIDPEKFPPKM